MKELLGPVVKITKTLRDKRIYKLCHKKNSSISSFDVLVLSINVIYFPNVLLHSIMCHGLSYKRLLKPSLVAGQFKSCQDYFRSFQDLSLMLQICHEIRKSMLDRPQNSLLL